MGEYFGTMKSCGGLPITMMGIGPMFGNNVIIVIIAKLKRTKLVGMLKIRDSSLHQR
jgi:hypothetical protein